MIDNNLKYKIADMNLAEWGHKDIDVSQKEMPGLLAIREKYGDSKPLKGVRIMGSLHMTIQTAIADNGVSVFTWKGESLEEYWWCTVNALSFPGGKGPQLIVDDGGDATLLIHLGCKAEDDPTILDAKPESHEQAVIFSTLKQV